MFPNKCGLRQIGTLHKSMELPCQDSVLIENGIGVVCDGLGSAPKADVASYLACKVTIRYFDSFIKDHGLIEKDISLGDIAADLIRNIREEMKRAADEKGFPVEHLDTTLNFVAVDKKRKKALIGRLGDGAIIIVKGSASEVVTTAKTTMSTASIRSDHAESELELRMIDLKDRDILGFMITTDGLEGEIYWKNSPVPKKKAEEYFNSVLTKKRRDNMLKYIPYLQRTNEYLEDDISLLIMSRATKEIRMPPDPTWLCKKCGTHNAIFAGYCSRCGRDFHMFYSGINFQEYGGRVKYFKDLNEQEAAARNKK